jgi:carboxymethylenebutenolidase
MVDFTSNGDTAHGYLALPSGGQGPGVVVIQEWWGLDPGIKIVTDNLAAEGFVAFAPDLYRGELAQHDEMDKAGELMSKLPQDRAARDLSGAVDLLRSHDATTGDKVGVVGFCMGGMLSWVLGAIRPDAVGAVVAYYGAPLDPANEPPWENLAAPVLAHAAAADDFFPPDAQQSLAERLRGMGKDVTVHVYEGTGHAFASEHDALGTRNDGAASEAWGRTIPFLQSNLG